MSPQILRVTRQSYRQVAQVLARAFVDDPVTIAAYRDYSPERRVKALLVDFTAELSVCVRRGWPIVAIDDGRMIAAAAIYPPGTYPLPIWMQWMILAKSIVGNGFYDISSWMRWLREADKIRPAKPHYYLEYLGVDAGYQGKGFGSYIVKHLTTQADERGFGCYLENANPLNLPFYQRLGFQVISQKTIIGIPAWFMWREPTNSNPYP